jgi:cytochrome c-type biogenesis protein CcmH
MTLFWAIAALMTVAALAMVIIPLLRQPKQSAPSRAEFDLTVYKDQLAEISRDRERGLLGDAEADAATVEIKRRMLKAADSVDEGGDDAHTGHRSLSRAVAACLAAVTPVIAFGFYIVLGSPNQPNLPHAQRDISAEIEARQGRLEKAEVLQLAAKLVETLKKKPDDIKGWLLLGRTYLTISEFDDALEAFRRATELSDRRPDIVASYAEAMVVAEDGRITARAKKLFTDILATDPFDPKARYYLGLEQAQTGNISGALQTWTDLIQLSPADAPWLETINQKIAVAAKELGIDPDTVKPSARAVALALTRGLGAPKSSSLPMTSMPPATSPGASSPAPGATPRGPSAADVEAAGQMSATDRDKMVRSMVNRLAERLKENPDDLAGWQRLAKAYAVLGEKEKAEAVKKKIEALTK